MPRQVEYKVGHQFPGTKLSFVRDAPTKIGRRKILVRCSCDGKIIERDVAAIRYGSTASCGCIRRKPPVKNCKCEQHFGNERWHGSQTGYRYHGCRCSNCLENFTVTRKAARPYSRNEVFDSECSVCDKPVNSKRYSGPPPFVCTSCTASGHRIYPATLRRKALWESQNRCCALCKEPLPWDDTVLDHDHACCAGNNTNNTCGDCDRGVLHHRCNVFIGYAHEDIKKLSQGIDYLEAWHLRLTGPV